MIKNQKKITFINDCNVEEKVRYWLEVSEYDYNEYRIGDYYKL